MFDWIFLIVTAAIAFHGLTFRDKDGNSNFVHLLFGCISLLFFMRVLFVDVLNLI
ncbi:MAG: hypothetical protein R8G33_06845 [Gammaproteobacteria bacterium]|nr:hypothetical protein [Gammaproteobacteria bacterium]